MNSTWLITSELANRRARKVLFTCVVYTNFNYFRLPSYHINTVSFILVFFLFFLCVHLCFILLMLTSWPGSPSSYGYSRQLVLRFYLQQFRSILKLSLFKASINVSTNKDCCSNFRNWNASDRFPEFEVTCSATQALLGGTLLCLKMPDLLNIFVALEQNDILGAFCRYRSTDYVGLRKTKEIKDKKQNNSK